MLRRQRRAAAHGGAEDDGEGLLAAEHIMDFRGLVDNLIHGDKTECDHGPIDDGAQAGPRRTYGDARKGVFGDRRGTDARLAEFLHQGGRRIGG